MSPSPSDKSLPLTTLKKIDDICRRFEYEWKKGQTPTIEAYLDAVEQTEREPLFRELLQVELYYRNQLGEHPTPEDYVRRFAEWEPLVLASFGTVLAEQLKSESQVPSTRVISRLARDESTNSFTGTPVSRGEVGLNSGQEPIPGYHLLDPLGKGGFGEVWKARAPGSFEVAFKFVSYEGRAGAVEQQALAIIQQVRHPGLLSIFGTWQTPKWLIIGMELADRTLGHRFEEAVRQGSEGIARKELLSYMLDAAKILDYLNKPRHYLKDKGKPVGIQHGDVKPQNIFLFGDGVKLGDFGLVSLLESKIAPHVGGLTFAYAAPEVLKGTISRWSDQFALAVTYCQMRSGTLPFEGTTRSTVPDLRKIPTEEREAILRALIVSPHDRWPNCRTFVKQLINAVRSSESGLRLESGQRLGAYVAGGQLLERIGRGRVGEVWKAIYSGGILVAVRVIPLCEIEDSSKLLTSLDKLRGSVLPYHCKILDFWIDQNALFIVSELADHNLRHELKEYATNQTPVPAEMLLSCLEGLALTLDNLHSIGLRHGRITVDNILCGGPNTMLSDCYWGWLYEGEAPIPPRQLPEFAAPEAYFGKLTDESDQLSLALLYAQLRTGRSVVEPTQTLEARTHSLKAFSESANRSASQSHPGMSKEEQQVLAKALAIDPSQRYPTCRSFLAELTKAVRETPRTRGSSRSRRGDSFASRSPNRGSSRSWRDSAAEPPKDRLRINRFVWISLAVLAVVTFLSQFVIVLGPDDPFGWWPMVLGVACGLILLWWMEQFLWNVLSDESDPQETLEPETIEMASPTSEAPTQTSISSVVVSVDREGTSDQIRPPSLSRVVFEEHIDSVWDVTFSKDGKLLVSGSMDNTLHLWDVWTGQALQKLEGHEDGVTCVRFVGEGTVLMKGTEGTVRLWNVVSASLDGTIRVWDATRGTETLCLRGHEGRVFSICVAEDSRTLVSGGEDRTIRMWDLKSGHETARWHAHSGWVHCVLLMPQGGILSAGEDRIIRRWNTKGTEQQTFDGHRGSITSLSISRDGALLASGSEDGTARIWNVETAEVVQRLEGHTDWVRCVTFSKDDRFLLTGSDDETILLWNVRTGEEVCRYQGHAWSVLGVAFSPTDDQFASASDDCSVRLWKLPSG